MIGDALFLAVRALRRNAMRSTLTVLGVVIGVGAVIVMVTLGAGTTASVTESIASLGSNVLMIMPGRQMGPGSGAGNASPFSLGDVDAIRREVASVSHVTPSAMQGVTVVHGNASWAATALGTSNDWFAIQAWTLAAGRTFTESEQRTGAAVCVIGETVRDRLFDAGMSAVGATIRVDRVSCEIIGVLRSKGQSAMGTDQDDIVAMPVRSVQRRIVGNQDIRLVQASVREGVSAERAQREIVALLRERRGIGPGDEDDFRVADMSQISETLTTATRALTALLSAVAAVSLLVGGIGIMNIMLVSVTERTREIGIRLAVGAMARDVLTQFLVEAVVLASLGGVLGIALALGVSFGLTEALDIPFVVSPPTIAVAMLFAGAVGVAFGFAPARKAARLNPIDALRRE
jgi:putative ABC transport system permease protein